MAAKISNRHDKGKHREVNGDDVETRSRINELNDTLLELIFTRLSPWKSLIVSKCVSKRWNSIISNPDFTCLLTPQSFPFTLVVVLNGHSDDGYDRQYAITEKSYFPKPKFPLDFIRHKNSCFIRPLLKFVANTNDLVVAYHQTYWNTFEYYVANPFTKKYIEIPEPGVPFNKYTDYMVGIAGFVNGVSTVNVSHRDNYNNNHGFRIVQFIRFNSKQRFQVYSSETGQWKSYLLNGINCPCSLSRSAITWNNKIHWMKGSKFVVMDPFGNLKLRVLNLPAEIGNSSSALSVCQNRLRIAQFEEMKLNRKTRRIKIWEIEDYDDLGNNDIVKVKLVINFELKRSLLNRILPANEGYDLRKHHRVVCCHPNDPQVVYFDYDGKLFYCNVVEHKYKKICYCHMYLDAFVFVHPP